MMKFHPLCEMFPLMSDAELKDLAADIKANGQREAGLLLDGMILDGRNRYLACQIAGVEFRSYDTDDQDPKALVKSLNIFRRHLTPSQRAMLAAEMVKGAIAPSVLEAAKVVSVSADSVKRARRVDEHGTTKMKNSVRRGESKVSTAATLSKLPKSEQDAVVDKGPKAMQKKAAEMREKDEPENPNWDTEPDASTETEFPFDWRQAARERVYALYERNKAKWNTPPPPAPSVLVDAVLDELRKI